MSNVSIKDNLAVVQQQLSQAATEAGRSPEDIQLIAVSKTKPAEMINEAVLVNHTAFGENMVQEAIKKMSAFNKIDNIASTTKMSISKLYRVKCISYTFLFNISNLQINPYIYLATTTTNV